MRAVYAEGILGGESGVGDGADGAMTAKTVICGICLKRKRADGGKRWQEPRVYKTPHGLRNVCAPCWDNAKLRGWTYYKEAKCG